MNYNYFLQEVKKVNFKKKGGKKIFGIFISKYCLEDKKKYVICKYIQSGSQGATQALCNRNNEIVGVVKTSLFHKNSSDNYTIDSESIAEILNAQLINKIIKDKHSPNFIYTKDIFYCNSALLNIKDKKLRRYLNLHPKGDYINILMEYVNNIEFNLIREKDYKPIIFQVILSIMTMKYHSIIHRDLHFNNVLISNNTSTGFLKYNINKKSYYIDTKKVVKIIDYGRASSNYENFNIKPLNSYIYTKEIYSIPEYLIDQRLFAISLLKSFDSNIFNMVNFTYYDSNNVEITNKNIKEYCDKILQGLKENQGFHEVLDILYRMINPYKLIDKEKPNNESNRIYLQNEDGLNYMLDDFFTEYTEINDKEIVEEFTLPKSEREIIEEYFEEKKDEIVKKYNIDFYNCLIENLPMIYIDKITREDSCFPYLRDIQATFKK